MSNRERPWRWLLLLCVAPAALSLFNQVQDVDPAQYADVARRMLEGHWLVLQEMRGPFVNKPPLMMWAQAIVMMVAGVGSFAARLPALLFGLLAILATFLVGRELRDSKHGLVAAVLLGSNVGFHHMILDPKVDMPLTAMSALAVWALLGARRRPWLVWLAWVFGALASLSKGPIGFVLPILAVGPELLRRGGLSQEPSLVRRLLSVRPVRGALLAGAVASPFYLAMASDGGREAISTLLWTNAFGRLIGPSPWADDTTPLYFVHTGLWAMLPFSLLLIGNLMRRLVSVAKARVLPPDVGRVALWWFVLPFVVISASSSKLPQYVYWLAPPAALLAAEELAALSEAAHRIWRGAFVAIAAGVVLLGVLLVVLAFPHHWPWLAVIAGVPALAWLSTRNAEPLLRTTALCACSSLGFLAYFHAGLQPSLLEYQPSQRIARLVWQRDPAATVLPCVAASPTFSLGFYTQRDVASFGVDELKAAVEAGRVHVALVGDGQAEVLRAAGLEVESLGRFATFPTSIPTGRFLLAESRESVVGHVELVSVAVR